MAAGNNRNVLIKTMLTIISVVVAYFSVLSTLTISRVSCIEERVVAREREIARNERNIAVLLEKVTTIEELVREMRQDLRKRHEAAEEHPLSNAMGLQTRQQTGRTSAFGL